MKEIKFRAWEPINKMMHYLDFCLYTGTEVKMFALPVGRQILSDSYSVMNLDSLIIEQYTGLKDKNGREIYEGDIIQDSTFKDRGSYIMAVEWESEAASFVLTRNGWVFKHYFYESSNPDDCEVIGNIHENQELLK